MIQFLCLQQQLTYNRQKLERYLLVIMMMGMIIIIIIIVIIPKVNLRQIFNKLIQLADMLIIGVWIK
jgi:hypothetical protein